MPISPGRSSSDVACTAGTVATPIASTMAAMHQLRVERVMSRLLGTPGSPRSGSQWRAHPNTHAALTSEVQEAQRVAFNAICVRQYGHSLVVGAAAGASFL